MINIVKPTVGKNIPWTAEQLKVLNTTKESVLVDSTAGSGKSCLLSEVAFNNPKSKILYMAFNKDIVESIRRTLPENVEVTTFHAFGLRIIRKNNPKAKVDPSKIMGIARNLRVANLTEKHYGLGGSPTSIQSWCDTCDRYYISKSLIDKAKICMKKANEDTNNISFSDMINMPVRENMKFEKYDIVLIDEYQDCGIDKIKLMGMVETERIVFVGDVRQKINSFVGSDPYIEDVIKKVYRKPDGSNFDHLTINESFRCPTEIVKQAQRFVPNMSTSKPGGRVRSTFLHQFDIKTIPADSLILCRANAPLLQLAQDMIRKKMDFSIKKKEIQSLAKEINSLVNVAGTRDIETLKEECYDKQSAEMERYEENGWNPTIPEQRFDTIYAILDTGKSLSDSEALINNLLKHSTSDSTRKLSTIHSAKGTESENVYYLKRDISKRIMKKAKGYQVAEELNVCFVGVSRSMNNLTYLD